MIGISRHGALVRVGRTRVVCGMIGAGFMHSKSLWRLESPWSWAFWILSLLGLVGLILTYINGDEDCGWIPATIRPQMIRICMSDSLPSCLPRTQPIASAGH
jgi:hypothetical protein